MSEKSKFVNVAAASSLLHPEFGPISATPPRKGFFMAHNIGKSPQISHCGHLYPGRLDELCR